MLPPSPDRQSAVRRVFSFYQLLVTKSSAVARIADRTGCQWPFKSSKDDFHVTWKPICYFLL